MQQNKLRLYSDLSWLWPLWGDSHAGSEYERYCKFIIDKVNIVKQRELSTLLNLGCGGGKNLNTLKKHYTCTGLDISADMLKLAKDLNPECTFVQADMRNFGLGVKFDLVFIDDAITYMVNRNDLEQVFVQAFNHLEPGGVMIVTPDATTETFKQNETQVFHSIPSELYSDTEVVYITSNYCRDLAAEQSEGVFVYLIRNKGELTIESEVHQFGLFPLQVWKDLLNQTGFAIKEESFMEGGLIYSPLICVKP
ncbi:MAG: class I SAM-dependent methyltransferase [Candidatus Cloacimonadaceae bacterium]